MDFIDLPVISPESRIKDAILVMQEMRCMGVFVRCKNEPKVFDFETLQYVLRTRGNQKVCTIRPRLKIIDLLGEPPVARAKSGSTEMIEAEAKMDGEQAAYATCRVRNNKAHILTRFESYGLNFGHPPTLWICRLSQNHIWQTHELLQNNLCREDQSPTDPLGS